MAQQEINFLSDDRGEDYKKRQEFFKKLRRVGLVLVAVLLVLAASFGYSIYLTNQRRRLNKKQANLQSRLEGVNDKIALLLFLKERLNKIGGITRDKSELVMTESFADFWNSLPEDIVLREATVNQNGVEINGQGSLLSISNLAEKYTNRGEDYRSAQLGSLTKNDEKEGWFDFALSIKFK